MRVELVEPEGEIWSGNAEMVIARTLDGEIGLLTGHAPVIGILYEGSMVQIRTDSTAPTFSRRYRAGSCPWRITGYRCSPGRSARRGRGPRGGAGGA